MENENIITINISKEDIENTIRDVIDTYADKMGLDTDEKIHDMVERWSSEESGWLENVFIERMMEDLFDNMESYLKDTLSNE